MGTRARSYVELNLAKQHKRKILTKLEQEYVDGASNKEVESRIRMLREQFYLLDAQCDLLIKKMTKQNVDGMQNILELKV